MTEQNQECKSGTKINTLHLEKRENFFFIKLDFVDRFENGLCASCCFSFILPLKVLSAITIIITVTKAASKQTVIAPAIRTWQELTLSRLSTLLPSLIFMTIRCRSRSLVLNGEARCTAATHVVFGVVNVCFNFHTSLPQQPPRDLSLARADSWGQRGS